MTDGRRQRLAESGEWAYCADQHDPLTALRIPVSSSHPDWAYLVSFDRQSPARPTDREALIIQSVIDYVKSGFTGWWQNQLAMLPLDVDGGSNTLTLHKRADGNWGYRRASWTMGPLFAPGLGEGIVIDLIPLLDRIYTYGNDEPYARWREWKANHADLFTEAVNG